MRLGQPDLQGLCINDVPMPCGLVDETVDHPLLDRITTCGIKSPYHTLAYTGEEGL